MTYAAAIRATLFDTHERLVDAEAVLAFFGRPVLVRELTAGQRLRAMAAVRADNPDEPDAALFDAMRLQLCVVDPDSGKAYSDGRTGDDGQPLIDPRTRVPVFTPDDLPLLVEARSVPASILLDAIDELSALHRRSLRAGDPAPDGGERDAGAGVEGSGDRTGAFAAA